MLLGTSDDHNGTMTLVLKVSITEGDREIEEKQLVIKCIRIFLSFDIKTKENRNRLTQALI